MATVSVDSVLIFQSVKSVIEHCHPQMDSTGVLDVVDYVEFGRRQIVDRGAFEHMQRTITIRPTEGRTSVEIVGVGGEHPFVRTDAVPALGSEVKIADLMVPLVRFHRDYVFCLNLS